MATVNFFDAFGYKWGQTGNTYSMQDDQYKLGWAFIGSTPPSVEQFNTWGQISDEKSNWLYQQFAVAAAARGVTVGAGTLDVLQLLLNTTTSAASETVAGIVELANATETQAGADGTRAVTPAGLASLTATLTRAGLVELATAAETQTGTDPDRAVTPATLAARTATETRTGVVELATPAEVITGTDTTRAVTSAGLVGRTATETRTGIARIATTAEAVARASDTVIMTPAKVGAMFSGANLSANTSGFQRLPNGILLQWGVKVAGAAGLDSVNFPVAFTTAFFVGQVCFVDTFAGTQLPSIHITATSLTGLTVSKKYVEVGNVLNANQKWHYFVIGY